MDFLQSQPRVGKFGGELRASTIGEGPKTFNPFNSKDNISSLMSDVMYDGLLSTDAETGAPIPKLAKSFTVNGNDYIVNLRRGVKWSDGREITADDVVFTWQNIIFDGFGNTSTRDSLVIDGKLPTVQKIDKYTVKFTTRSLLLRLSECFHLRLRQNMFLNRLSERAKIIFIHFYQQTTTQKLL